jgi:TPR repeat protein
MKDSPAQFAFLRDLLRRRTGVVIDDSKQYLVVARLMPIVRQRSIPSLDTLVDRIRTTGDKGLEKDVLNAMMTHETSFFRDKSPFDTLRGLVTEMIPKRAAHKQLVIWSAACSTGQEPYSIAMLLNDHFPELVATWRIRIIATDISEPVLARAREGVFSDLETNRGLPPDLVKKIHHLRKGAEAGRWDAIIDLARHLIAGEGLERNPEEAYALLIRAAEEGSEESVELVGQLYAEGLGVPKSLPDAIYWMQIGSDEGSHRAEIMLESLRKNGQLPDPDQYPKNFAELLELARKDRPAACYEAGVFYLRGQGVRKNEPEGARWILRAAELGHPRAQWHIADILEAGRYVPRDAEAAARWRETHRATVANLPHIPANDSESYFLVNGNTDP